MKTVKKIFFLFLRISVSVALLIFLFRMVDVKKLLEAIKHANTFFLISALLIFFWNYILAFLRWNILLEAYQIHIPFRRLLVSFSGGIVFNLILPSTVGGDFVRSIDLAGFSQKPRQVVASVLLDRLSGYAGVVCVAILAMLPGYKLIHTSSVLWGVGTITMLLILISLVLFNGFVFSKTNRLLDYFGANKISQAIKNLHQEVHIFRHQKKVLLKVFIVSILIQSIGPLSFYLVASSLGVHINILYFFIFLPIIGAITLLPISIGGLGLKEAAVIFFFAQAGVSKDLSFASSLLTFSFTLFYCGIGGLIYVFGVRGRRL